MAIVWAAVIGGALVAFIVGGEAVVGDNLKDQCEKNGGVWTEHTEPDGPACDFEE